jgi:hypothetical protein
LSLQDVQPVAAGETAVHADSECGFRERLTQVVQQGAQEATGPVFRGTVAGPQHDRHQILIGFVVEGQRGHQGQVPPGVIVSVEEGERLLPMGGSVGRVEVNRDALRPTLQTLPMVRNDGRRHRAPYAIQRSRAHRILKPRQGRLRRQGRAGHRIAAHRQVVQRIVRQPGRVVRILVPTGQADDPLPQQVPHRVSDLVRVPTVEQTEGHAIGPLEMLVQRLEQHRPAIRAGRGLIEPSHHRLQFGMEFKRDLRYTRCRHRVSFSLPLEAPEHHSYRTDGRPDGFFVSPVVNYLG